jgi:ribosomal-protein-serine acetyltransferase
MFRRRITDEIELALIEEGHAEEVFRLTDANREYLREWLFWLDQARSVADTLAFIKLSLRQYAENRGFQAGIWFKGRFCGVIGHHNIDWLNRSASLGYWLDAGHQGRGIMTKCCRAMVDHAFDELELNRVVIRCATGNRRSRAIPERLGFTLEGVEREAEWLYDHFVDLAVYSLLKTERGGKLRI